MSHEEYSDMCAQMFELGWGGGDWGIYSRAKSLFPFSREYRARVWSVEDGRDHEDFIETLGLDEEALSGALSTLEVVRVNEAVLESDEK